MADEYESERDVSRAEAAAILRDVADGVAGGSLRIGRGDEATVVDVPAEFEIELEYGTEDGDVEVEVELEWPAPGGAAAATDEGATDETAADETATDETAAGEPAADDAVVDDSGEGPTGPAGPAAAPQSLARFEVFRDRAEEWRWRLVHRNGNVIATGGEGYTRKENALKGLRSVMRNSPDAAIGGPEDQ